MIGSILLIPVEGATLFITDTLSQKVFTTLNSCDDGYLALEAKVSAISQGVWFLVFGFLNYSILRKKLKLSVFLSMAISLAVTLLIAPYFANILDHDFLGNSDPWGYCPGETENLMQTVRSL